MRCRLRVSDHRCREQYRSVTSSDPEVSGINQATHSFLGSELALLDVCKGPSSAIGGDENVLVSDSEYTGYLPVLRSWPL
jgi:hypothetical protein